MKTGPVLFVPALLLLAACSNPPYPRGDVEALYPAPPRPAIQTVVVGGRSLQFAEMPAGAGTPMLFVHGSPGDWKAWARYLDAPGLAGQGPRRAIDRPGFGGSGAGAVMPDLRSQAEMIAALIPAGRPAVLVGHSLGGPLVAWIAIDHPEKVCGLVMVAGSVAPDLEAPRWYNRAAESRLLSWALPDELLWSNREILTLRPELQKLDREWTRLQRPVIAIQGLKDQLVDPYTVDYLETRVPEQWLKVVRVPDQGHFLLWDRPATVMDAMLSLPCWH